ncbi:MAG: endonuclease/exonuclease/phosphatase family protein, partial [Rhodobacteraceae bacterium]|nr:endonuclease/exonuclease/phosphatase family protein [Paracoccaceae bacterium]
FSANGYGDHPRSRSAHAIRLFDYKNGWPITIAHMHGLRDLTGKQDTPARLIQAERLRDLTLSVAKDSDRIVVCGDFNVLPDSKTFDIFAKIGMHDLVITRGFTSTRGSQYKKPGKFADYMLVNAPLAEAAFDVIYDPEVSDHCPLVLHAD